MNSPEIEARRKSHARAYDIAFDCQSLRLLPLVGDDANLILKAISELTPSGAIKLIGLMRVDIYIPILTYIFGQSMLNGHAGIVSLYRLRNELYGLEQDNILLMKRFRKVIVHEMGHAFGLIHCHNPTCIMRSSTYVEDLDQKNMEFCYKCKSELDSRISEYHN